MEPAGDGVDGNGQCEAGTKQGLWEPGGGHPAWLGGHVNVWEACPGLDAGEEQGAQPSSHQPCQVLCLPSSSQLSAPRDCMDHTFQPLALGSNEV